MQKTIGKRRIGVEVHGQGAPLVLMHAFPLNRSMFEDQKKGLADAARMITFDVPGVGESEAGPVTMESIADLAAALLDAEGIERAVVGGVSMGGYAAFAFARRHPDRLQGLLLANTRAVADTAEGRAARAEMAKVARQQGAAEIATRMLPKLLGETSRRERPEIVERVRALVESTDPEAIAALLQALADRADSHDLLDKIAVPTLVVAGAEDPLAPPEEASEWAKAIPGASFTVIPKAGHLANLEAPEAFNAEVRMFLGRAFRSRGGRV